MSELTDKDPHQIQERLWAAFQPEVARQAGRIRENGTRFVHYTSADSGLKILRSGRMLLRNSTLMNDFSEVQNGLDCLVAAYNSPEGERLKALLKTVQDDLPEILEASFNGIMLDLRSETYLISISEHGDPDPNDVHEDELGRLSMWRAYAPRDGIAFIFRNTPFVSETNVLNAFTTPVVYASPDTFGPYFAEMVDGIEANIELLKALGGQNCFEWLSASFRLIAQSTKHRSFKEEREWRIIYSPTLLQRAGELDDEQLQKIPTEIMSLGGVPQRIYAIPFQNYPDEGFVGATVPELIDRVLIGPSEDSYPIAQAFVAELTRLEVPDADQKVHITGIPLRS